MANTIELAWDSTEYWNNIWGSKDTFVNYIAPTEALDASFFQEQLLQYFKSYDFRAWSEANATQWPDQGSLDLGDYTAATYTFPFGEISLIVDDFGNGYLRLGPGRGISGPSLTRGDVYIHQTNVLEFPSLLTLDGYVDIDQLGLTPDQKNAMIQSALAGPSTTASAGMNYGIFAYAIGLMPPHNITLEAGIGGKSSLSGTTSVTVPLWRGR